MENFKEDINMIREFEGKTVEEAVENAIKILGLQRDQIKITVLSEEQRGLFGMDGAKPAKIRVAIPGKI